MNLKRIVLTFIAVVSLLVFGSSQAAEYKIGYVDGAVLLDKSPLTAALLKKLENEFLPRKQKLVAQNKQLNTLVEKKQRDAAVMSEAEVLNLEKDIRKRDRELKNAKEAFNEDIALKRNQELLKIRKSIAELIISVAKENNYDIVLEKPSVIYASKRANITQLVLDRMKSEK
jgi:outer membrane protein